MAVYQRALESETDITEREELQKGLDGVIKRYYIDLYQRARRASSRQEMMKITILALSLGVEGRTEEGANVFRKLGGWFRGSDKDLEKAIEFIQERRLEIFLQLPKEAEEANRKRAYKQAVSLYDQARELDPELYNQKNLAAQYNRIRNRIEGQRLALEGQRLLEERKYQQAREKFQRADTLYSGQAAVEKGLKKIKSEVEIREALLAFFDGRSDAGSGGDWRRIRPGPCSFRGDVLSPDLYQLRTRHGAPRKRQRTVPEGAAFTARLPVVQETLLSQNPRLL